jgi:hypothetical protein
MLLSMSSVFSPSEAAEQSGFSLDTLRYYERIGLLDDIDRAPSGHRPAQPSPGEDRLVPQPDAASPAARPN